MRIGEFAEKHDTSQDTIRYYLDMGLLVTEKKGGQYRFGEQDSLDMDKIKRFKELEFSINDIIRILTIQRISGTNTEVFRNLYLPFLEEKKQEVEGKLDKYNKVHKLISERIVEITERESTRSPKLGFPISSLNLLACPECGSDLKLNAGTIEKNMIMSASIQCDCGYRVKVEDGIYVEEKTVRPKLLNGERMPTKEEYLESCSVTHTNFIYKGLVTLMEYVNTYGNKPKYILELDNCVGFFLLQYINDIPESTTFILVDYDKDRISQLKRNLEMYYKHKRFIFFCCEVDRMPVRKSSIDMIVDSGLSKPYAEEKGGYLMDIIEPLLKPSGILASRFIYMNSTDNQKIRMPDSLEEIFNRENVMRKLRESDMELLDTVNIGAFIKDSEYDLELRGAEVYQVAYAGIKR